MNRAEMEMLIELLEKRARQCCVHCKNGIEVKLNDLRRYAWHDNEQECNAYEELWVAQQIREDFEMVDNLAVVAAL